MNILQYIRLFFATKEEVAFNESTTNKTISITSSSTDTQYSSAKSVWNIINNHSSLHELKDLITDNTHQTVTASQKTTWDNKQDNIDDLSTIRSNASLGATALQSGDDVSELNNDSGYLTVSSIEDSITSTETTKSLSANMGKELQDQIDNLSARGRFLALWDCTTGLPNSNPTTNPYSYRTGDYYIIGNVATGGYIHTIILTGDSSEYGTYQGTYNITFSFKNQISTEYDNISDIAEAIGEDFISCSGTLTTTDATYNITKVREWSVDTDKVIALCNSDGEKLALTDTTATSITDVVSGGASSVNYKPNGSSYTTGVASTTVESNTVEIDYVYYYDGSVWRLQSNIQKTVSFSNIGGYPTDNVELASALNSKATGTKVDIIDATASESVQKASIPSVYAVIQYIESLDGDDIEY